MLKLSLQSGDKESATSSRKFFRDLKFRGSQGRKVTGGIMDALPGLGTVFDENLPEARVERCQVLLGLNVLAKVLKK